MYKEPEAIQEPKGKEMLRYSSAWFRRKRGGVRGLYRGNSKDPHVVNTLSLPGIV